MIYMKDKIYILWLKKQIKYHNYCYYVLNKPKISDVEYDFLMEKLKNIEKEYPELVTLNSPTQNIGGYPLSSFNKIQHLTPMLSLDNIFNKKKFLEFHQRIYKILKNDYKLTYSCELKIDGLAVNILYKNGKLVHAATRGDGLIGEDITNNIYGIKSIPICLKGNNIPNIIEIRGEVFITHDDFKKLNEYCRINSKKIFSNPRNAAAGSLRQVNANITAKRSLSFLCYGFGMIKGIKIPTSHYQYLILCKQWGLPVHEKISLSSTVEKVIDYYEYINIERSKLNFDIDGIVVKVDSIHLQKILGNTSKAPKWAIAFKYPVEKYLTLLKDVKFQVGRSGLITPVASLSPIKIDGITINNATLYNIYEIKKLDLRIGDIVNIYRAGNVIPKIVNVILSKRTHNNKTIAIPNRCPICNSLIEYIDGMKSIRCIGVLVCKAQIKGIIKHFASKEAINIVGIDDKIIAQLVDKKYIQNIVDLYYLNIYQLMTLNNIKLKKAEKIIQAIHQSKKTTFAKFIYSLSIRNVGINTAKELANVFNSLNSLMYANLKTLKTINGVGDITAKYIINFFKEHRNQKIINKLINEIGIYWKNIKINYNVLFTNKIIVITGTFKYFTRAQLIEKFSILGANVTNIISKRINLLIVGKSPGDKLKRAISLGITIIHEKELYKMLGIN
uniref:DNA ligase n=1 Tax=Candidatus Aschnera chinzeii TaxID=1485666 RepID=A0AAT9G506_9ENTR|nr:MAG: NAD-dependent DNA ligase LigA [Candidatus Aschnera chinzeii]